MNRAAAAPDPSCRIDVWLWRARFFKTRNLAGGYVAAGRVRLIRGANGVRLDKASRTVRQGDEIVFVLGGRAVTLRILAMGERRGSASEARALYELIAETDPPESP